ncbi:MAG: ABC transporter ATP-binding protein [Propionibacteriaceae bacterium]|jgi:ABC-2 type transport system ATP-binding protein|nr:ABC transporter ATP-binding protein [Propionibacteriaceae bacterium]
MTVLRIDSLTKTFHKVRAVDEISLEIPADCVFGFIGENGAGKTTTMRMILGLLKPDSGAVWVCDEKVRFGMTPTNRRVGYLPDVPQFYPFMTAREYLRLCGEVSGLTPTQVKTRSNDLLELVGLAKTKKKIGGYSRGMKQRLGVAQALVNQPPILICDEPTSALDPLGRKDVLNILTEIRGETTVVFSTHILSDVERICDRTALIHQGKIVMEGSLADLKARHGATGWHLEFADPDSATSFAELMPTLVETKVGTEVTLRPGDKDEERAILRTLADHDLVPLRFESLAPSIESLFLEAVQ